MTKGLPSDNWRGGGLNEWRRNQKKVGASSSTTRSRRSGAKHQIFGENRGEGTQNYRKRVSNRKKGGTIKKRATSRKLVGKKELGHYDDCGRRLRNSGKKGRKQKKKPMSGKGRRWGWKNGTNATKQLSGLK